MREKRLNKITVIPPLFSNFQATWSDGKPIEGTGEVRKKNTSSCFSKVFDEEEGLKLFVLNCRVNRQSAELHGNGNGHRVYSLLYVFQISDPPAGQFA